jgi:hypothetical protein
LIENFDIIMSETLSSISGLVDLKGAIQLKKQIASSLLALRSNENSNEGFTQEISRQVRKQLQSAFVSKQGEGDR